MKQDIPNKGKLPRWMFLLFGACALAFLILEFDEIDESIIGLNQEEVESNYGTPDYSGIVLLDGKTLVSEYQSLLLIWYSDSGKKDTVQIKELWWEGPIWTIIVWLHNEEGKWIAIDQLQYPIIVAY